MSPKMKVKKFLASSFILLAISFPLSSFGENINTRDKQISYEKMKKKRFQLIRAKEAEKRIQEDGEAISFLATAHETDGRVSIYDSYLPKGNKAPWHYHEIDDEIFYIVSGRIEFGVDKEKYIANAGDLVIAGPYVRRRFMALADSHMIVINSPAGPSEGFLRDIMSIKGDLTDADYKRFAEKYKIHVEKP